MTSTIIQMEHIKKTYDGSKYVLNDLSFTVQEGDLIIIKGLSGSGKSTLLNILGLLDIFDSGSYILNNIQINPRKNNKYSNIRSNMIGFIFQSYHLIESISIQDNILLPFLYSEEKINLDVIKRMETILESFNLIGMKGKKVSLLSGGEKQRVAIARAIIKKPPLIIADEPTGNLDEENTKIIMDYLKRLTSNGTTIVLVTHDMNLLKYGDTSYLLQEGRLIE